MITKKSHFELTRCFSIILMLFFVASFGLNLACLITFEIEKEWVLDKIWQAEFARQREACKQRNMHYVETHTFTSYKCADLLSNAVFEYYLNKPEK